ncbi:MAG: LPS-assembly protein LptD [Campylobacterales bacterium]|nr:LPS-assembly protein LptD [Campylobacterales bacterium]
MLKHLSIVAIFSIFAFSNENIEIIADKLDTNSTNINGATSVIAQTSKYHIQTSNLAYNFETKELNLTDNVFAIKDNLFLYSNHADINVQSDKATFCNIYLTDNKNNFWLNAKDLNATKQIYQLENATLSSCNFESPAWFISFDRGSYDTNSSFVTLHEATLHASNIPLLYFPYLSFSASKQRRTGLLKPDVGLSTNEGLYFMQPFYVAPEDSYDIEISPQIRTNRGYGIYSTFRFVDSYFSKGEITTGYFKEQKSYAREYNLKNENHFGAEFNYISTKVLSDYFDFLNEDGFYVDINYLNDIDYINLQKVNENTKNLSNIVTSKINYIAQHEKDYLGLYTKYFIDTTKVSNKDTLQLLPMIQYHRFQNPIFNRNILLSADFKISNNYRIKNLNAMQSEFLIPVSYHKSFFDNYLDMKFSENLYFSQVNYSNLDSEIKDSKFFRNYHQLAFSSDLVKEYPNFLHGSQLYLDFIIPSFEHKKGDFIDFVKYKTTKKSSNIRFSNFFFNKNLDEIVTHRVNQRFIYEKDSYKYENFEHEVELKITKNISLYDFLSYSHKDNSIEGNAFDIAYIDDTKDFIISHYFSEKEDDKSSYFSTYNSYKLNKFYTTFIQFEYDYKGDFVNRWEIGLKYFIRCWDYKISYKEEIVPILTSLGTNSVKDKIVYFQIGLFPIGGFSQKFHRNSRGNI